MAFIEGTNGPDSLVGGADPDLISGYAGNDTLRGGAGNDTISSSGGIGEPTVVTYDDDAGDGNNSRILFVYDGGSALSARATSFSTNTTGAYTVTVTDVLTSQEVYSFTGALSTSDAANPFRAGCYFDDYALNGLVIGRQYQIDLITGAFDPYLQLIGRTNSAVVLDGEGGNDSIQGSAYADSIVGGSGNDTLIGGGGDDKLFGGVGDDVYYVDAPGAAVVEAVHEGIDRVFSSADYTLSANVENLDLVGAAVNGTGNGMANEITGNDLGNFLNGGAGSDTISGGAGNDTLASSGGVGPRGFLQGEGAGEGNTSAQLVFTYSADIAPAARVTSFS